MAACSTQSCLPMRDAPTAAMCADAAAYLLKAMKVLAGGMPSKAKPDAYSDSSSPGVFELLKPFPAMMKLSLSLDGVMTRL